MTAIPKLTAAEAITLRYRLLSGGGSHDEAELRSRGLLGDPEWKHSSAWWTVSTLGRAALAAYDAAERAKIRVEAMRECEAIAAEFAKRSGRVDDPREFFEDLILDIRALIAKETP